MKTSNQTTLVVAMAFASFLFLGNVNAEDVKDKTSAQEHGLHHPEAPAVAKDTKPSDENNGMMGGGMMNKDMMGKMDMNQMMGMMNSCMEQHKDGKMCDHQTMEECQKNMDHKGCQKMMKEMKSQKKTPKTK